MANEGMFSGFLRARQAMANIDATETATAAAKYKMETAVAEHERNQSLAAAVRQVMGMEEPAPQEAPAPAPGLQQAPIDPTAGEKLAHAAGLPSNLRVRDTEYERTNLENQGERMRSIGSLMMAAGDFEAGRKYMDSAAQADERAKKVEDRELEIKAKQSDAMGSIAATVSDQKSLDRAILAASSRGYDPTPIINATNGGQWNEESRANLEQYTRAALSVKEQADLDLGMLREERAAENTASMIEHRQVQQANSRQRTNIAREGLLIRQKTFARGPGGGAKARRVSGMTVNEWKGLYQLENKIPDPFEMVQLKKHNPAAYEEAKARASQVSLDFPAWFKKNAGEDLYPGRGPQDYTDIIERASTETGVPPEILRAVMQVESGGDPTAVSGAGAQGTMQIMPATGRDLGLKKGEAFDPDKAIPAGARYLSQLYDQFGDWNQAVAAYNAGPGRVASGKALPAETRSYVPKVKAEVEKALAEGGTMKAGLADVPPETMAAMRAAGYSDAQILRARERASKQAR